MIVIVDRCDFPFPCFHFNVREASQQSAMASSKLFSDAPEPDYDHLTSLYSPVDDDLKKKGGKTKDSLPEENYILGTLIVRVVAARHLDGGWLLRSPSKHQRSYNPYASVKFRGQTQRTSAVPDSVDPLWPRSEAMYMDVALPLSQVTFATTTSPIHAADGLEEEKTSIPEPIVSISLFHASGDTKTKHPSKKSSFGDSDDPFLGTATLNVTPLLTGKKTTLDRWLSLGGANNPKGTIRIVCEYETSDPPPRPGDIVRFNRFCHAEDLYPVPITLSYKVQEVDHDDIVLEYVTQEGWICTFIAHRFMVICEDRHQAVIEMCHDEFLSITERLGYSPIVREVQATVDRVPDEGLLFVGINAVQGAGALLDRWWKGGVSTAVGDLQYATNWDGRFNEEVNLDTDAPTRGSFVATTPVASSPPVASRISDDTVALPGMPCCPIAGEPMVDPVVAADGHTYERNAIARWLQTSDKSPLTGSLLPHKNLVPNYVLLSSLQEAADAAAEIAKQQHAHPVVEDDEEVEDRKMPAI
jgi:U-box domain/C2 domain